MSKIKYIALFTTGAAIGSAATWHYAKKKYEQLDSEKLAAMREAFARAREYSSECAKSIREALSDAEDSDEQRKKAEAARNKPPIGDVMTGAEDGGYVDYAAISTKPKKAKPKKEKKAAMEKPPVVEAPYVIPPDEFGELYDYEKISLVYYADKVLADDSDELVDDVDATVGSDWAERFGEFEADSVFVRNDARKCDYEILRDSRKYSDVTGYDPRQPEE